MERQEKRLFVGWVRALNLFDHSDKDIGWGGGEHGGWVNFTAPSRM
jgi:hypothetical protein